MARMVRKADLPTKTCATCGRPFAWRKKWERVWAEVRYCSDRCRREARAKAATSSAPTSAGATSAGATSAGDMERDG